MIPFHGLGRAACRLEHRLNQIVHYPQLFIQERAQVGTDDYPNLPDYLRIDRAALRSVSDDLRLSLNAIASTWGVSSALPPCGPPPTQQPPSSPSFDASGEGTSSDGRADRAPELCPDRA